MGSTRGFGFDERSFGSYVYLCCGIGKWGFGIPTAKELLVSGAVATVQLIQGLFLLQRCD